MCECVSYRSWSLGFSLKYLYPGHVMSVQSLLGHRVTVVMVGVGQLVLEAYVGGVKMASRVYPKQITPQKFVNVVRCVCVCVHVCVCMYVCVCICMYVCMCIHLNAFPI